ncbi:MAG: dephospho-CoA kinase [Lachnospiraceae bacterium]|nr:dephospho-CoA kinase [Lachnospiraceae bacterium]
MQVIGITGGVGAGKSVILEYLKGNYKVRNLEADRIAEMLMKPGTECYDKLMKFLPVEVYNDDETINRSTLAEKLFESPKLRQEVNQVVHPAVKVYIQERIEEQRQMRILDYVIIEAALLIEDHYDKICDEIWYIYATEEVRRQRLLDSRGYTPAKIEQIFESQMPEEEYRAHCQVVIDNNGTKEEAFYQVAQVIKNKGEMGQMEEQQIEGIPLVFGLDIGTRNVVGTVGYRQEEEFFVMAQYIKEHETRSMLDGQIHDIGRVGRTINAVKKELESQLQVELNDVCIAAAGRVLKTVTTTVSFEFAEESVVSREDVHTLDLLGIEKAQQILNENNDTKFKFYCVGYSVVKYYLNGDIFSNLENHKAEEISEEIIVTFLPEDVVDGLYSAVGLAGLRVANMTLEPIAAINVAIPEAFRMLNIALVDIGAGTSDISVTRDGSIIAYGMIPSAGDELTELLVQHYLVDFKTAEHIKLQSGVEEEIEYQDIMMIKHTVTAEEVWQLLKPLVDDLAESIAAKIKELNGGETVSATFVVGGGGKIHGFIDHLSFELGLPQERVALRGEEVLQEIHFEQKEIKKDPLLVTPIGICLNFYDQKNNFIFVHFNGERMKLYDNDKLTIVDAALQAGFPNEQLFPRRGKEINFTVNGRKRIARGEVGESAVVRVNGHLANINSPLEPNSDITIEPSTQGNDAVCRLGDLEEYGRAMLNIEVNGRLVSCPRFAEVNGIIEMPDYEIKEGDRVELRGYYTVSQIIEFMDVEIDMDKEILVNNKPADPDTLVYENFSIEWTVQAFRTPQSEMEKSDKKKNEAAKAESSKEADGGKKEKSELQKKIDAIRNVDRTYEEPERELSQKELEEKFMEEQKAAESDIKPTIIERAEQRAAKRAAKKLAGMDMHVVVNKMPVTLSGKKTYVFVDVFDVIGFDMQAGNGRNIVTLLNGESPSYTAELKEGDVLEIYWEES